MAAVPQILFLTPKKTEEKEKNNGKIKEKYKNNVNEPN